MGLTVGAWVGGWLGACMEATPGQSRRTERGSEALASKLARSWLVLVNSGRRTVVGDLVGLVGLRVGR